MIIKIINGDCVHMSLIDELNQIIYDLPFNKHQPNRNDVAHFCEHDGVYIRFTKARTTWQALSPCAIKPWWLFLEPLRKNLRNKLSKQSKTEQKITTKIADTEVIENA